MRTWEKEGENLLRHLFPDLTEIVTLYSKIVNEEAFKYWETAIAS